MKRERGATWTCVFSSWLVGGKSEEETKNKGRVLVTAGMAPERAAPYRRSIPDNSFLRDSNVKLFF
jgi:hypothetical protein